MMDITNKAIKVSRRMVEIEDALSCGDLMARDADNLRIEYEELSEWNELLSAYFDCRNKSGDRIAELALEKAELVAQVAGLSKANSKLSQKESEQGRINALECALTCLQFAVSLSDDEALKKVLNDTLVIHNELEDEGVKPNQCLSQIKGDAVEKFCFDGASTMTTDEAKQYIASIAKGG